MSNINHTLYVIVGASGGGKDTLVQEFIKAYPNYSQVLSYTTRRHRYDGENTHIFIEKDEVEQYEDEMVAYTNFCGNEYFATSKQLKANDFYVIDPKGINFLNEKLKEYETSNMNIVTINITASMPRRYMRMRKRGDSLINTIKRLANDRVEFKNFKYNHKITNNNFYTAFEELTHIVAIESLYALQGGDK